MAIITSIKVILLLLAALIIGRVIIVYRRRKHRSSKWKLNSFRSLHFAEYSTDLLPHLTEKNVIGYGPSGKVYQIPARQSEDFKQKKRSRSKGVRKSSIRS